MLILSGIQGMATFKVFGKNNCSMGLRMAYVYEIWLITGEWLGGGIDHTPRTQSSDFSRVESDKKE